MDALVEHLNHQRLLTDYVFVAAIAIMIWDYILTLHLEVTLVWHSRWNYTKVMFLLTRYLPLVQCVLFIHNQMGLDSARHTCEYSYPAATWLVLISMNIAEVVLALRTWAIYEQNFLIGVCLAILMFVAFIVQCWTMAIFNNSLVFSTPPYSGYRGCFITDSNHMMLWNYLSMMIIEGVVLGLMAVSAYKAYRSHDKSRLLQVVHRDGIMFYVYILAGSLANLIVIQFLPHDLLGLFSPMESIIYSVLTTRIIFNIREMATEATTELHTRRLISDGSTTCYDGRMILLSTVVQGVGTLDRSFV